MRSRYLPKSVLHYDNPQDKEALIAQLNDNRVINAILLEGDRTVDWATVPASGQSLPQRELLSMAESACHKAILGQTLTSDVSKSGGSLAQAKVHAGVQADTVMRYAENVADIINTQLIPAIVHLNYGNVDVPMPEIRCKLPQAVANIERAQFWAQVLQIPGMQVIKSDIYESLGIAMPAQGDEVLSTPAPQENALEKAMQGFGQGKQDVEPDKGRKDETALAARAEEGEPKGIAGWLAPLKKKLLEAKKNGASYEELKQMMLETHLNTRALAGAMEENIKSGFFGDDDDELEAASNTTKHKRGCNQHADQPGCTVGNKGQIDNKQGEPGMIANKIQHPTQWKPITMPDKITAEEAREKLAKGIHVKNPLGEVVTLDNRLIKHWENANKEKLDINKRLAVLPLIEEVVKNPAEIWEYENGKRTYLASVIDPYQPGKNYTVAFTLEKDNTVLETYFPNSNNAVSKRVGKLVWNRETAVVSGT